MSDIKFVDLEVIDIDKNILPTKDRECTFIHKHQEIKYVVLTHAQCMRYLDIEQKFFSLLTKHALSIPENKDIIEKLVDTDTNLTLEERTGLCNQLQLDDIGSSIVRDNTTWDI